MTNRAWFTALLGISMLCPTVSPAMAVSSLVVVQQDALTVADVVKLLQAKLSEDVILTQIAKKGAPKSVSTEDLLLLKSNGASDAVIRALVSPNSGKAVTEPTARTTTLPSVFGTFVSDGQNTRPLNSVPVRTVYGLVIGDRGFAVDGIAPNQEATRLQTRSPSFILYDHSPSPNMWRLSSVELVATMYAGQFNILGTDPRFFKNIYRKSATDRVAVNLLRPHRNIQMTVAPIDGKPGMFRLEPIEPLDLGRYVLYGGDSLHAGDRVFTADLERQREAFLLEIEPATSRSTSGPSPLEGGVPYFLAPDKTVLPLKKTSASVWIRFGGRRQLLLPLDTKGTVISGEGPTFIYDRSKTGAASELLRYMEENCAVYEFRISNGRAAAEVRDAVPCTLSKIDETIVKWTIAGPLAAGVYAVGPSRLERADSDAQIAVFPFVVK